MKVLNGVAAAVVLTVAGTSCFGGAPNPGKSLKVAAVTGDVQFRSAASESWRPVLTGLRLAPGVEVKTGAASSLSLARDDGARVDVGPASAVGISSVRKITLDAGRALASVNTVALTIAASGVDVLGKKAVFRVDRGFAVRVGVYGGSVAVTEDADRMTVPGLHQIEVAGGIVPRDAAPLKFSTADPWDKQLLADVIDLDRELRTFGRAFKANYASRAADPGFYASLMPGVSESDFAALFTRTGDTSDVLLGVVLARRLPGAGKDNLVRLLNLRLAGGTWGLIAKIVQVAFREYVNSVIATTVPGAAPTTAPTSGNGRGTPTSRPRPTGSTTPKPSSSPSTSPSPTPTSPSPSPSPCSDLDRLLGRCGSPAPPSGLGLGAILTGTIGRLLH